MWREMGIISGLGIIEDAVQHFKTSYDSSADQKAFTGFLLSFKMS